ncbi:hypothetical protein CEXT_536141, partial [Caerostris extrusa]
MHKLMKLPRVPQKSKMDIMIAMEKYHYVQKKKEVRPSQLLCSSSSAYNSALDDEHKIFCNCRSTNASHRNGLRAKSPRRCRRTVEAVCFVVFKYPETNEIFIDGRPLWNQLNIFLKVIPSPLTMKATFRKINLR